MSWAVRHAVAAAMHVPFYRELYQANAVKPRDIRAVEDFARLPVINKDMLRSVPLEQRSAKTLGRFRANTGGSSGSPLSLYVAPDLVPVEWAHMHTIWRRLGYDQSLLKLAFGGRNLGHEAVVYDGLRHQYSVNVYQPVRGAAA